MDTHPSVDQIRAAMVEHALTHGYAVIVQALGTTRSNFTKFLHGSKPHRTLLARMHAWYAEHYAGVEFEPMPTAFGRLTPAQLERVRAAALARMAATSLRAVSRAVGMAPDGLLKFLNGSTSNTVTVEKVRRWYLHEFGRLPSGEGTQPLMTVDEYVSLPWTVQGRGVRETPDSAPYYLVTIEEMPGFSVVAPTRREADALFPVVLREYVRAMLENGTPPPMPIPTPVPAISRYVLLDPRRRRFGCAS